MYTNPALYFFQKKGRAIHTTYQSWTYTAGRKSSIKERIQSTNNLTVPAEVNVFHISSPATNTIPHVDLYRYLLGKQDLSPCSIAPGVIRRHSLIRQERPPLFHSAEPLNDPWVSTWLRRAWRPILPSRCGKRFLLDGLCDRAHLLAFLGRWCTPSQMC